MNKAGEAEDELAHLVVLVDFPTERGVMLLEVLGTDAMERGCLCSSLGRPIRSADTILEEPGRSTVADQHHPVSIGWFRGPDVNARVAVASMVRNHCPGKTVLHFRGIEKPINQVFIYVVAQQYKGDVVTLWYQRRKLEPWYVKQEYMHGRTKCLSDDVAAQEKFTDKCLGATRSFELMELVLEDFQKTAINTGGNDDEVVGVLVLICAVHGHEIVFVADIGNQSIDNRRTFLLSQLQ